MEPAVPARAEFGGAAGNLALLVAFGYTDLTGITFALLRRFRELVWIGFGLVCLAALGRQDSARGAGGGQERSQDPTV